MDGRSSPLGRIAVITAVLAVLTAVIAVPLQRRRQQKMTETARDELTALTAAIEEYRAREYRLPDRLADLELVGYSPPPSITVCAFRHVPDARQFDDHVIIALRHRVYEAAVTTRFPNGTVEVRPAAVACEAEGTRTPEERR